MATLSPAKTPIASRLAALCRRLAEAQVDAYLVPSADTHLNEYVPAYQRRRAASSGFTGSAGDALISPAGSHLFVDSRYHVQAEHEVDPTLFRVHKLGLAGEYSLAEWLTEMERQRGSLRVGFDPFVLSIEIYALYAHALRAPGSALIPLSPNYVDEVWSERPSPPAHPIYALPDEVTGCSVAEKLAAVREQMERAGAQVLILTKLDEIAWLTNLRGSDVDHNPVFEAYLVLERQRAVCLTRVPPAQEIQATLAGLITFAPYSDHADVVRGVVATTDTTVWLDPAGTTMGTRLLLPEGQRVHAERNPVVLMKALKNAQEIASSRAAHQHAAAAKIRSLARLDRLLAAGQPVSERTYAEILHEEYSREEGFEDLSFPTISAAGANGAIVHYSGANAEVMLRDGQLFLIDSGTQMLGGTTDDTRTVSIGTPSPRQQQLYTIVLRCHIELARQKFPEGTSGLALDAVARAVMWNAGLDYGHGTGHGVGAFLNVHEGPQRLATRGSEEPLQIGMIVSNEPGYYEAGWGGIRLENLYVVTPDETLPAHPSGKRWLQLEPLTLIPFDHRSIDWTQLSDADRTWLARYHRRVWETVGPMLSGADRAWLRAACEPFF
ncbi:MAG TPA: aminopeptidase P family protein [Candidatus Binatia bacterium]|nr:aminopeptidase P family protein [Candidatus Binatia bacterium]